MIRCGWPLLIVLACCGASTADETSERTVTRASRRERRSTWDTVIGVARSDDGFTFTDTGQVLVAHAAAPDLVVLPSGDLVALLDYAPDPESTTIAVARSSDSGRSWSSLEPIRLERGRGPAVRGHHGDLILMPGGGCRLYFADAGHLSRRAGPSRRTALIRSAISRDGREYQLDDRTRVAVRTDSRGGGVADVHPMAFLVGGDVHLLVQRLGTSDQGRAQHLRSRDSRKFTGAGSVRVPELGVRFVGSIVAAGDGLRAYVSADRGVRSLVSKDAREWAVEDGLRARDGWDPAVAELKDGSFLMLYCKERGEQAAALSPIISVSPELQVAGGPRDGSLGADWPAAETTADVEGAAEGAGSDVAHADSSAERATMPDSVNSSSGDAEGGAQETRKSVYPSVDEDGYVSLPDFCEKVDYFQWFCDELLGDPADNAYFAYDAFMPGFSNDPASKPGWPASINDMFNGGGYDGPPAPWNPLEHAEWEATHQSIQRLLAQFREATRHDAYAMPIAEEYQARIASPDGEVALINMILPQLSSHRTMVKAVLADAWRADRGGVSGARMLDAWETSLRDAGHLNQGPTLIEELVSVAERALVYQNARWALKEGVFRGDEIEAALDVLSKYDPGNRDPRVAIRGEHAFALDTMQHLFWPNEPGGEPTFREDRVSDAFGFSDDALAELRQVSAEDLRAALDASDRYYRELGNQMSVGYPQVRAADISATHEAHARTNALTNSLLPDLGRVHKLRARAEASRRATQLAYATHLFRERNGRWPETLEEFSGDNDDQMTIDPFTGGPFGYHAGADGVTIYSRSENGIDDGGRHSPRWDDGAEDNGGADDYVFWPPQHASRP